MSHTGKVLGGRYAVGEVLGEGGWGAVYGAVQTDLGRRVALKVLHLEVAVSADAVARFEREAKAAAALGHPNIVQVTDFRAGGGGEPPFLVMELLTGSTLGAVLRAQTVLAAGRVATIAFQMLSALDVAHRARIVHRDVKPDNVFLVAMPGIQDFVKLLDFGIAKLSAENVAQLTSGDQTLGSPAFMAPEQVRGLAVDGRTDVYAVGATMYFALAGRLPFDATNIAALLGAIAERPPVPLATVAPMVDPRLAAVVHRALEKDPGRRWSSAAEMRAALEPWIASGVTSLAGSPAVASPPAISPLGAHASAPSPASPLGYTAGAPSSIVARPTTPAAKGQSPVVVVLAIVVGLLLLGGAGAVAALYVRDRAAPSVAPADSSSAAASSAAPSALPTSPAPSGTSAPKGGATRVAPAPTTPPAPVVDAGGGKVIPPPSVDAGARTRYGGTTVTVKTTTFGRYDMEKGRAELDRILPALQPCYAATEYEPPDHQYAYWSLTIDANGAVSHAGHVTAADGHPQLDPCVSAVLRTTRWQALPGGGEVRVGLGARVRSAP